MGNACHCSDRFTVMYGGDCEDDMTVGDGVRMQRTQYLAGFKADRLASYPTLPMLPTRTPATINGTIDDVAKAHPELTHLLYNDVKMCKCGKPCAYTMVACNSCGQSLKETPITKSENVFCAFLLGVERASKGFPYTLSLRGSADDVLIIDDLLALSPCHLNAIPKKHYIPDWRFLLNAPVKALQLLDKMESELWYTTKKLFLDNVEFRKFLYKPGVTEEEIQKNIIVSFNFPPSQFQLHIQWIVPPLTPFQHFMAEQRNHFHEDRAFPMSYVRKVLALNKPYNATKETRMEDIIAYFDRLGVNYKQEWREFYAKSLDATLSMQNWNPSDFTYIVEDGQVYNFSVSKGRVCLGTRWEDVDAKKVQEQDKLFLQNYGRPYSENGKPSGTYIKDPLKQTLGEGGFGSWP